MFDPSYADAAVTGLYPNGATYDELASAFGADTNTSPSQYPGARLAVGGVPGGTALETRNSGIVRPPNTAVTPVILI